MEQQKVQECLIEIFTVYYPNQQGIPRKYLVREDSLKIFDHNTLKTVKSLSVEEKDVIWFNFINMLGEEYVRARLQMPIRQAPVIEPPPMIERPRAPIMPPTRSKKPEIRHETPPNRVSGHSGRFSRNIKNFKITDLEAPHSPPPRKVMHFPEHPGEHNSYFLIDEETKDIDLDYCKDIIRNLHSHQTTKAALNNAMNTLSRKYSNRSWQVKLLSVGLLFGSPRIVVTDLHNIYVISAGKRTN